MFVLAIINIVFVIGSFNIGCCNKVKVLYKYLWILLKVDISIYVCVLYVYIKEMNWSYINLCGYM